MPRDLKDGDDYSRSKILSDREVNAFLTQQPDAFAGMVLPGVPPATFSIVDARDAAEAMWAAARKGRRGERYIAAGRTFSMAELVQNLQQVSGVAAPKRAVPRPLLYARGCEGLNLFPALTARENGELTLDLKGIRDNEAHRRAEDLLAQVGLSDKLQSFPADLSGGQKQRVAIARALAASRELCWLTSRPRRSIPSVAAR